MKTYYPIRTLLAFFICSVTFASTGKDSLAVGKRTRTFATATYRVPVKTSAARGAVSTKGVNSVSQIITTKGKLVLVENGADVGVQVALPGTSRIADAQLTNGRWKEIKSTSNILQKVGTDDLPQFKAYIQNITDIGDIKYAFDKEILKAPTTAGGLGLADDVAVINHAREQMRLVFKNNAEEIFEINSDILTVFDKLNGQGKVENFEDLFDLANSQSFTNHPIIQNLVEIQ